MQQYMKVKNENPDCIIFFRMGDFYETFFEDAILISKELEITLTSRGKDESKAPLAGIPYHAIDPYLAKLVKKGYKIGIVEQVEDPKLAKGLVKRELVRIITPGTIIENTILDKGINNYIACLSISEEIGLSFCDVSTGEFLSCKLKDENLLEEITKISPAEIIIQSSKINSNIINTLKEKGYMISEYEDYHFNFQNAYDKLKKHFQVLNLEGYGLTDKIIIESCGALLSYIKEKQMNNLEHLKKIKIYNLSDFMFLDNATIRNLELIKNIASKNDNATLISVLDKTLTSMGKRLMRKWITSPLIDKNKIEERLNGVEELKENIILRYDFREILKNIYDIERLIGRVSFGNANPKDIVSLGNSFKDIPKLKELLTKCESQIFNQYKNIPDLKEAKEIILNSIKEEPSTSLKEGNIIKFGYNKELDDLRILSRDSRTYLAEIEEKERENTGIKNLRIKYNKIIGYFIEITKSNLNLVPNYFIRKQSQLNSERFVTEELKELEIKILGAQERIYELEYNLFLEILEKLKKYIEDVQEVSNSISILDCLSSFSIVAQEKNYCKPKLNSESKIELRESRHPVIEAFSQIDFINNDCFLDDKNRTMIITGPNMAGKSTYLRQVALISLMAQIGSFVPAKYANLCVLDRVFSRIGAYDDLVNHQSTFMVEMNETANILNNATEKSLVILDEIGRGTSTFDGVSLAWAIAEYLNNEIKCKTLFATHYHHLNKLSEKFDGINNFNIAVEEKNDKILFLRKIIKGGTDKSYGIQVAKLAGLPENVINCAKSVMNLIELEDNLDEKILKNNQEIEKNQEEIDIENIKQKITQELKEKINNELNELIKKIK